MKILLINSEYPPIGGGAGNASANLARLLVQRGCEVTVLTSAWDGLPVRELQEGVKLLRVRSLRRHVARSTAWEQVSFILAASLHCRHLARRPRPDVTLAFFGLPSGAVALLLRRLYGIPYVVSLRGGDVPGFRPYDFRFYHQVAAPLLRRIWRGAQAIVANSRGLQELALGFSAERPIEVIPNGVEAARFASSGRIWSPPHILSVGRVVHQKGLDLAMRALSQLQDLEWTWTIAGDGPQMPMLKALAQECGIGERVHFLGWLSPEPLKVQYAAANLFLFPSRHEGMPNAVLEAMASGLPVVASRIAGSDELVVEGETGTLVPSEDVEALRAALRRLLVNAAVREQMGRAARQRVEQSFTWVRVAQQYEQVLRQSTGKVSRGLL